MNQTETITPTEERLLVLAPTPRDARICCETVTRAGMSCLSCRDVGELCDRLEEGAGAVLLAEEAFAVDEAPCLLRWLKKQPPWSDLPLLFLTHGGADSAAARRAMDLLGNVLLVERPLRKATLISAARSALRGRRRQYQTRSHLAMLTKAREEAEDANRAKSEFLANMSHEIRTPMTVIMGSLEYLSQESVHPEHRSLLDMAETAADRLLALIDDILDFSRIEARRVDLLKEPFRLRELVEKTVGIFSLKAQEKGLSLTCAVSADLPETVLGSPDRIGQVLINLVGNAVKFTHRGEIAVKVASARGEEKGILFSIRDTGIGIPAAKQHLLFQTFSQVDSSRTRRYGGTGLGLAISRGLVELMGGTIGVESTEGKGSTFSFVLPLETAEGNPGSSTANATRPSAG